MVYLTHYAEYPIYEAAEGGYYYAGVQMVHSKKLSKRAAKKLFKEMWEDFKKENLEFYGFGDIMDTNEQVGINHVYPWMWNNKEHYYMNKPSYYIGDGEFVTIERKQGKYEKGQQPYC